MKKNHIAIAIAGLIFIGLIISNLVLFKETIDLNEQVERIFELEAAMSEMKLEHQKEIDDLKKTYEDEISRITNEYTRKFETVKKALNAFEYEIEEFYKNKHILQKDYIENINKINEVRKELGDD